MTDHSQPKVSILMAYYNNLEHVQDSIKSVYQQSYSNWELIIVNDCSPDPKAVALIESLQEKYGFSLIHNPKNVGASKAFQIAFEHSKGEYVSLISHDDMYTADKIEHSMTLIHAQDLDAVYCNGMLMQPDGTHEPFPVDEVLEKLKDGQEKVAELISSKDSVACLLTQGAVYKRQIFSDLEWMKDYFLLDDWPFTIAVWRNYKTGFDPKPVYIYRFHEGNIHKQFWKWFPARVQVVSELTADDQKLDVLAYLLNNIAEFSLQNGRNEDAFRLAAAGLALTRTEENCEYARKVIRKSKPMKALLDEYKHKARSVRSSGRKNNNRFYRKIAGIF